MVILLAIRSVSFLTTNQLNLKSAEIVRKFSQLTTQQQPAILSHPAVPQLALQQQRNYVKFSLQKGKRKTVDAIVSFNYLN